MICRYRAARATKDIRIWGKITYSDPDLDIINCDINIILWQVKMNGNSPKPNFLYFKTFFVFGGKNLAVTFILVLCIFCTQTL